MEQAIQGSGGALKTAIGAFTGINLSSIFQSTVEQLKELVTNGIQYSATLEQGKLSIAALLQGTTQLKSADGERLSTLSAWNINLREASQLQQQIAALSANTLGTQEQLMNTFRVALSFSRGQKASTQELLQFSQGVLNVATLMGLTTVQQEEEVRQMLLLETQRGQVILPVLGLSLQQAMAYRDQGTLIQEINSRLAVFRELSQASSTTWVGLTTSAATFAKLVSANAFEETFSGVKAVIQGFAQESARLRENGDFTAELTASEEGLRRLGVVGAEVFAKLTNAAADATNSILEFTAASASGKDSDFVSSLKQLGFAAQVAYSAVKLLTEGIYFLYKVMADVTAIPFAPLFALPLGAFTAVGTYIKDLASGVGALKAGQDAVQAFNDRVIEVGGRSGQAVDDLKERFKSLTAEASTSHINLIGAKFTQIGKPEDVIGTLTPEARQQILFPNAPQFIRTGTEGRDREAEEAYRRQQQAIASTREEIAVLSARNNVLADSVARELTLEQAQTDLTTAETYAKTKDAELAAQYAKTLALNKARQQILTESSKATKALAQTTTLAPQQVAIVTTGLENNLPFEKIQQQLKNLAEDANWKTLADQLIALGGDVTQINDLIEKNQQERAIRQQTEDFIKQSQTFDQMRRAVLNETAQEQVRNRVLREGLTVQSNFEQTQRRAANAATLLAQQQQSANAQLGSQRTAELQTDLANKLATTNLTQDLEKQYQTFEQLTQAAKEEAAQEQLRAQVLRASTAAGKSFERAQRDAADAVARLQQRQQVTRPGALGNLLPEQVQQTQTLLLNKQVQATATEDISKQLQSLEQLTQASKEETAQEQLRRQVLLESTASGHSFEQAQREAADAVARLQQRQQVTRPGALGNLLPAQLQQTQTLLLRRQVEATATEDVQRQLQNFGQLKQSLAEDIAQEQLRNQVLAANIPIVQRYEDAQVAAANAVALLQQRQQATRPGALGNLKPEQLQQAQTLLITQQTQQKTNQDLELRGQSFIQLKQSLSDELQQEEVRNQVLATSTALGRSYEQTQRDIADALSLVAIRQQGVKDKLAEGQIAAAQALQQEVNKKKEENDLLAAQQQLAEKISDDILTSFKDMAEGVKGVFESLKGLVEGILNDISQELLRRNVVKPLSDLINDALGSLFGAASAAVKGATAGSSPVTTALGSILSPLIGAASVGITTGAGVAPAAAQTVLGTGQINANTVNWQLVSTALINSLSKTASTVSSVASAVVGGATPFKAPVTLDANQVDWKSAVGAPVSATLASSITSAPSAVASVLPPLLARGVAPAVAPAIGGLPTAPIIIDANQVDWKAVVGDPLAAAVAPTLAPAIQAAVPAITTAAPSLAPAIAAVPAIAPTLTPAISAGVSAGASTFTPAISAGVAAGASTLAPAISTGVTAGASTLTPAISAGVTAGASTFTPAISAGVAAGASTLAPAISAGVAAGGSTLARTVAAATPALIQRVGVLPSGATPTTTTVDTMLVSASTVLVNGQTVIVTSGGALGPLSPAPVGPTLPNATLPGVVLPTPGVVAPLTPAAGFPDAVGTGLGKLTSGIDDSVTGLKDGVTSSLGNLTTTLDSTLLNMTGTLQRSLVGVGGGGTNLFQQASTALAIGSSYPTPKQPEPQPQPPPAPTPAPNPAVPFASLDFSNITTTISDGLNNAFTTVLSAGSSVATTISSGFSSIFSTIFGGGAGGSSGLISSLSSIFSLFSSGGGAAGSGDLLASLTSLASFIHTGGTVGTAGTIKPVTTSVFSQATRYHQGGAVSVTTDSQRVASSLLMTTPRYHTGLLPASSMPQLSQHDTSAISTMVESFAYHQGGNVLSGGSPRPVLSPLVMEAPRFHQGLMPNEIPAILEVGEAVIPRRSMQRLSPQGRGLISALIKGMVFHDGGTVSEGGTARLTSVQPFLQAPRFHEGKLDQSVTTSSLSYRNTFAPVDAATALTPAQTLQSAATGGTFTAQSSSASQSTSVLQSPMRFHAGTVAAPHVVMRTLSSPQAASLAPASTLRLHTGGTVTTTSMMDAHQYASGVAVQAPGNNVLMMTDHAQSIQHERFHSGVLSASQSVLSLTPSTDRPMGKEGGVREHQRFPSFTADARRYHQGLLPSGSVTQSHTDMRRYHEGAQAVSWMNQTRVDNRHWNWMTDQHTGSTHIAHYHQGLMPLAPSGVRSLSDKTSTILVERYHDGGSVGLRTDIAVTPAILASLLARKQGQAVPAAPSSFVSSGVRIPQSGFPGIVVDTTFPGALGQQSGGGGISGAPGVVVDTTFPRSPNPALGPPSGATPGGGVTPALPDPFFEAPPSLSHRRRSKRRRPTGSAFIPAQHGGLLGFSPYGVVKPKVTYFHTGGIVLDGADRPYASSVGTSSVVDVQRFHDGSVLSHVAARLASNSAVFADVQRYHGGVDPRPMPIISFAAPSAGAAVAVQSMVMAPQYHAGGVLQHGDTLQRSHAALSSVSSVVAPSQVIDARRYHQGLDASPSPTASTWAMTALQYHSGGVIQDGRSLVSVVSAPVLRNATALSSSVASHATDARRYHTGLDPYPVSAPALSLRLHTGGMLTAASHHSSVSVAVAPPFRAGVTNLARLYHEGGMVQYGASSPDVSHELLTQGGDVLSQHNLASLSHDTQWTSSASSAPTVQRFHAGGPVSVVQTPYTSASSSFAMTPMLETLHTYHAGSLAVGAPVATSSMHTVLMAHHPVVSLFHTGGSVLSHEGAQIRNVDTHLLTDARRYHAGTTVLTQGATGGAPQTQHFLAAETMHRYHTGSLAIGSPVTTSSLHAASMVQGPMASVFHVGGSTTLQEGARTRLTDSRVFLSARRYHAGLAPVSVRSTMTSARSSTLLSPLSLHSGGLIQQGEENSQQTWSSGFVDARRYHTGLDPAPVSMSIPRFHGGSIALLQPAERPERVPHVIPLVKDTSVTSSKFTRAIRVHSGLLPPGMASVTPRLFVDAPRYHEGSMSGDVSTVFTSAPSTGTPSDAVRRDGSRSITIIQNVQTPDLAGFNKAAHQLSVDQRISQEVALRRFN